MSGFNFDYVFLLFIFTLLFNVDKKVYTSLTTYYVLFMYNVCVYIFLNRIFVSFIIAFFPECIVWYLFSIVEFDFKENTSATI